MTVAEKMAEEWWPLLNRESLVLLLEEWAERGREEACKKKVKTIHKCKPTEMVPVDAIRAHKWELEEADE